MEPFWISCTTCQVRLRVRDPGTIGQILTCPKCGSMVLVAPPQSEDHPVDTSHAEAAEPARPVPQPPPRPAALPASAVDESFADPDEDLLAGAVEDGDAERASLEPEAWPAAELPAWRVGLAMCAAAVTGVLLAGLAFGLFISRGTPSGAVTKLPAAAAAAEPTGSDEVAGELEAPDRQPAVTAAPNAPSQEEREHDPAADGSASPPPQDEQSATPAGSEQAPDPPKNEPPAAAVETQQPADPPAAATTPPSDPPGLAPSERAGGNAADRASGRSELSNMLRQFQALMTDSDPTFVDPAEVEIETPVETVPGEDEEEVASGPARPPLREIDLEARLADRVQAIQLPETSLLEFTRFVTDFSTIPISIHPESLQWLQLTPDTPVTLELSDASVADMLHDALAPLGLTWQAEGGQILIRRAAGDGEGLRQVKFDVTDLAATEDATRALANLLRQIVHSESWESAGGQGKLQAEAGALVVQQREEVLFDLLFACERLRVARGLPLRSKYDPELFTLASPKEAAARTLSQPVTVSFLRPVRLVEILRGLEQGAGVRILVNWQALAEEGWSPETSLAFSAVAQPLQEALARLIDPMQLRLRFVSPRVIELTAPAALESMLELRVYPSERWLPTGNDPTQVVQQRQAELAGEAVLAVDAVSGALLVSASPEVHQRLSQQWGASAARAAAALHR